ncbi:hypothetical protein RB195_007039 [Necator americanus]|uniref:Uncharacterized protein n=1 Tax=Necator americanus TaxID=51031 RepID=A0ABR1BY77_NECAM
MDDLPERQVRRTRPFGHIDIIYFGPLSAKRGDKTVKVYGTKQAHDSIALMIQELEQQRLMHRDHERQEEERSGTHKLAHHVFENTVSSRPQLREVQHAVLLLRRVWPPFGAVRLAGG